ncbi:FUN14 family protein [Phlyctema vagabunda]|uniref:FUN14 family protein n=1 Tax=Phlyctema vagabunda TaxID=108571 RepID=A0ABR4PR70_9HELO
MASLLLRPLFRPALGLGLGLSITTFQLTRQQPMWMDAGGSASLLSTDSYRRNAQTPVVTKGRLNPKAVRQISSGSIIGLCAGLAVSTFSKSLALLLGLLVVGVQVAASYGINLLPYNRMQKYVTSIDLRSAVQDNVAFKLSFGSTFALAAFMHF